MFVVVYNPETNETLYQRRMGPYENLDLDRFAEMVADWSECTLDDADGYIPNCSGDIRVEFRPHRDNSTVIWSGKSYYFTPEPHFD